MSHNRSSSNQNTRIFTPTVILQQPSSRMVVTLDGSGYAANGYYVDTGITAGDCIYFDAVDEKYYQSKADTDVHSEVFGIVESKSANKYTVVTYGSIKYPTERLDKLKDIGYIASLEEARLDVLFLDNHASNPGGLTGQVLIPSGSSDAIVKPVIQLAPHGEYDGVVVNYLGYKIGNSASLQLGEEAVGTIVQSSAILGDNYLDLSVPHLLNVADNPSLYSQFGVKSGVHHVKLTMLSSYLVSSIQIGALVTQSSPSGNGSIGQVIATQGNTVTISRTSGSQTVYNGYCTIGSNTYQIISNSVEMFSTPVRPAEILTDGTSIKYWLNTVPVQRVTIPNELAIDRLTVLAGMSLGSIVDLEAKINQLQTDINQIKTRIGM